MKTAPSRPLICPAGNPEGVNTHNWHSAALEHAKLQGVLLCPDHDGCPTMGPDPKVNEVSWNE